MQVGEVRVAEDADFQKLKDLCSCHDGWKQDYHKNGVTVWTKANDISEFKMIKVSAIIKDISASTLYDVLHDSDYRGVWDRSMHSGYELCCLNPNNDVGYYALKTPKPITPRDFVIQRSWLDVGKEYYIINHSVNHQSLPPMKGFVRGISYITGYWIKPTNGSVDKPGSQLFYVTQSDPKGKLPVWVVNRLTQTMAPKVISRIHKACRGYQAWKRNHTPDWKPWLYPEQITLPRLNINDIKDIGEQAAAEAIDESELLEADMPPEDIDDV